VDLCCERSAWAGGDTAEIPPAKLGSHISILSVTEIGCPSLEIPGSSPTAVARMGWGDDAHETLCINKKGRKTCRRELPIFT
jgi:hypothetical protein